MPVEELHWRRGGGSAASGGGEGAAGLFCKQHTGRKQCVQEGILISTLPTTMQLHRSPCAACKAPPWGYTCLLVHHSLATLPGALKDALEAPVDEAAVSVVCEGARAGECPDLQRDGPAAALANAWLGVAALQAIGRHRTCCAVLCRAVPCRAVPCRAVPHPKGGAIREGKEVKGLQADMAGRGDRAGQGRAGRPCSSCSQAGQLTVTVCG